MGNARIVARQFNCTIKSCLIIVPTVFVYLFIPTRWNSLRLITTHLIFLCRYLTLVLSILLSLQLLVQNTKYHYLYIFFSFGIGMLNTVKY